MMCRGETADRVGETAVGAAELGEGCAGRQVLAQERE